MTTYKARVLKETLSDGSEVFDVIVEGRPLDGRIHFSCDSLSHANTLANVINDSTISCEFIATVKPCQHESLNIPLQPTGLITCRKCGAKLPNVDATACSNTITTNTDPDHFMVTGSGQWGRGATMREAIVNARLNYKAKAIYARCSPDARFDEVGHVYGLRSDWVHGTIGRNFTFKIAAVQP